MDTNMVDSQTQNVRNLPFDEPRRSDRIAYSSAVDGGRLVTEAVYRLKQPPPLSVDPIDENLPGGSTSAVDANASTRRFSGGKAPLSGGRKSQSTFSNNNGNIQDEGPDEMILRLSNEFQPIVESEWDTVIYIGPPPQEHQQDDHEYEYIKQHFSKPYLLDSQTLKDANSAQFNKFLGPMSARAERRLKKLGVHHLIPQDRKPKYYIDLRPMQDDDEALLMITELTCTPGILSWHISHLASGIPKTLIGGKDDLNYTAKAHARSWIEVDDAAESDAVDENLQHDNDRSDSVGIGILDLEPEYSAIRHYTAIERLLHAIVGRDPKLNSAAKVWTYFSIAKFFDCATNLKVTSWIYDWLFSSNNSNFIQANPEVAYRMAMGMRSPDILRATFAMLVGELALLQAGRSATDSAVMKPGAGQVSVHGRTFSHLDDDEINRIDHAAHSLTGRMINLFDDIANGPLNWTTGRSELAKFDFLWGAIQNKPLVDEPFDLLREYIRGEVFQALSQNLEEGDLMRLYRVKGFKEFGWLKRSQSFANTYNAMPLPQRILTQSFWSQLENYGLYQEYEKVHAWSRGHSLDGLSELSPDFSGEIICVSKVNLVNMIERMNGELTKDKSWTRNANLAWSRVAPDTANKADLKGLQEQVDQLPTSDQEIVRALQGLGMADETRLPQGDETGNFNADYHYQNIAMHYRNKGGVLTVKPAVLLAELSMELRRKIMREVLTPGYVNGEMGIECEISISQMDILLCLNDHEWKYLPLWAGGLDDGTGGVFAELDVPDMEAVEGFRGGKIGLGEAPGEGSVGGSFSMAGDSDDFDQVMTDEGVSTVGKASRNATDGRTSAGASTVMSLDE